MSGKDYLPKNDLDVLTWATNFLNYLSRVLERLSFPAERFNRLKELFDLFEQKLAIAHSPASCTPTNIMAKNLAKAALKTGIRQAVNEYLTYNHMVTTEDRSGLGIPIRKKTRTPAPVADTSPGFIIDCHSIYRLIVHFYDSSGSHKKAKPPGQHGAEIAWVISDVPIEKTSDLLHSSFDTRTPFTLEFEGDQRGKTVYLALRWENTRGLKGQWSTIQKAIIP
jgi:hypothetical protein